jgi:hypothetical protein
MRLALAVALCLIAGVAHASEWGLIEAGVTTQDAVRARYGGATKTTSAKVEGYDSTRWVYEAAQAPPGFARMTVDFGILTPQGFKPSIVRVLQLEPNPNIFTRDIVLAGWGAPDRLSKDKDADVFFYEAGLIVYFDRDGRLATTLIFTPRQKPSDSPAPR